MLIHYIALFVFIVGVVMLYTNDNLKKGITWINNESYEDSPAFVINWKKIYKVYLII